MNLAPIVFLQVTTKIVLRRFAILWKPHPHQSPHMPSGTTQTFYTLVTRRPLVQVDIIRDIIIATSALVDVSIQLVPH